MRGGSGFDSSLARCQFAVARITSEKRIDFAARFVEQFLADVEIDLADLFARWFFDRELAGERLDAEERLLGGGGDGFGLEIAERNLVDTFGTFGNCFFNGLFLRQLNRFFYFFDDLRLGNLGEV